ncbi:MAG: LTA synthase family protein [Polyangiaceae bacterium]
MPPDSRPPSPDVASTSRPARLSIPRIGEWLGIGNPSARTWARGRRFAARAMLASPFLLLLAHDLLLRADRIAGYDLKSAAFYGLSLVLSAAFWTGLLAVSARRRGIVRLAAVAFGAALALFAVGAQTYTFSRYQTYMDHQSVLVGTSMMPSIWQQLASDRATFALALAPPVIAALAMPFLIRAIAPTRPRWSLRALDVTVIALLLSLLVSPDHGGVQGQSPDIMYVSALGQLARARWDHNETVERVHPGPRSPIPLPDLRANPPVPRDVVFVLTESVRAQSVCVAYDDHCKWTPFSNSEAPNRIPLMQMRSVDSTTAISLAVMWNGLRPESTRAELHSAPLLWEYAHAAQIDTAYFTSQNLLFGNSGAWLDGLPLTRRVSATEIEPDSTLEIGADDGKLVDYATGELGALREPYFAVVHLSNTHFPYKTDPKYSPFLPEEEATGPGYETEIRNRYADAIYLQDRAIGRLIHAIRSRPEGNRVVIVFLSDHGEQLREKGAVGHTGTLYEEEIRIPAWIDAPKGTLTSEEERHLKALRDTPLTTLDIAPTMLDLLGLLDEPRIAPLRAKMPGKSLLRGGSSTDNEIFLSNCTELWQCAFKNWGAIKGTKKLIANQGDHAWNCYDVAEDPSELRAMDPEECGDLQSLAESKGHGRPF